VDEGTCDDEASVAKKTRTDNQSLGIAVLVRLKREIVHRAARIKSIYGKNRDPLDTNNDFTPDVKGQPFPLSPFLTHWLFPSDGLIVMPMGGPAGPYETRQQSA